MSTKRLTGPMVPAGTGPRMSIAQTEVPTTVYVGGDRDLIGAREVDIAQISPDPAQPRKRMDPARLTELAASIAKDGVLQALLVREDGLRDDGDMRYIIIAGGRRYAAIALAIDGAMDEETRRRLARVPVVVRNTEEAERRVLQLVENLQREELPPVEEARALKELMRLEGLTSYGAAERIHRSQGYVDERLRLLRHEEVEEAVEAGVLTQSAAAAVASLPSADERRAWIGKAESGETVRPRDVYASKPARRHGGRTSPPTPSPAAAVPVSSTPAETAAPIETPPDDVRSPVSLARPQIVTGSGDTIDGASLYLAPGTSKGDAEHADMAHGETVTRARRDEREGMRPLLDGATPDERAFADRIVAFGAAQGWSCDELVRHIRALSG